jgi:MFS family permease
MNIGFYEAFTGIGFLAGPLLGSFMFTVGGYVMPFAANAAEIAIIYPIVYYGMTQAKKRR